jgi:uncharacterized protein (TIGR03437 family)
MKLYRASTVLLISAATVLVLKAQTLTTLASFIGTNGDTPWALVQGADGNFYGTTFAGGSSDKGTIFKVTPSGALTTLYSFCAQVNCADGASPFAGLIQASDGNFYGTTYGLFGASTVFRMTPSGALTTLYTFCSQAGCADGVGPEGGLLQAADGNFYGTTTFGGSNGAGTVFKLTPAATLTTLYTFCTQLGCADGAEPQAGLIQASDGNFYGTTQTSGVNNAGTVFKLTPTGTLTTLYNFCSQAGCVDGHAAGKVIQGSDGNLYGTTQLGGTNGAGTAFQLSLGGVLTTLYNFCSQAGCADGDGPDGLIQASDGNLYGTTYGTPPDSAGSMVVFHGTIFKLTLSGTLATLYTFCSQTGCSDGGNPAVGVIQASDGNFYGTTASGGTNPNLADGTVFKFALTSSPTLPTISPTGGVVNGASFQTVIGANSWITIFGTNFSPITDTWDSTIVNGALPTVLDGVRVSVGGTPAYVSFISSSQINALAPNVGAGTLPVTVTNSNGTSLPVSVAVQAVQPAFFQWGNYAVATTQDFSLAVKNGTLSGVTTTPAKPGEVIILWGAGFGPTNPAAPVGSDTPSIALYSTASPVTVTVGGLPATVYGAALSPGYAGLYQVAIQIPASLTDGDYPVVATVAGANRRRPSLLRYRTRRVGILNLGRIEFSPLSVISLTLMDSDDELKAEIERLRAENASLKKTPRGQMSLKVSEKGALSVYGLGRFPVTLYREQWEKLLGMADQIRTFIQENDAALKKKE